MRPPVCEPCFKKFRKAFNLVNRRTPADARLTDVEVSEKAARRAQAVKFGTEWVCPRCTTLETELGKEILFSIAYPNRDSRRRAVKGSKLKNNGHKKG